MVNTARRLVLVTPELFWSGAAHAQADAPPRPSVPALEQLLARSAVVAQNPQPALPRGLESAAASLRLFGVAAGHNPPVAALTHAFDSGDAVPGWWMRADPVYLHPDRDRLVLFDSRDLALDAQEAVELAGALATHFADAPWHLEAPHPQRWYLSLPQRPEIDTFPLPAVHGRDVGQHLPRGPQARRWHAWLNEAQMVLHASPVNQSRETRGLPPVNSVWLWGEGELPQVPATTFAQVWSDDPLTLGLAKLSCAACRGAPRDAAQWLTQAINPGTHLVTWGDASGPCEAGDVEAWAAALERLEQSWITPLLAALRRGELSELLLDPCTGRVYRATAALLRRWWRRRRPVTFHG